MRTLLSQYPPPPYSLLVTAWIPNVSGKNLLSFAPGAYLLRPTTVGNPVGNWAHCLLVGESSSSRVALVIPNSQDQLSLYVGYVGNEAVKWRKAALTAA